MSKRYLVIHTRIGSIAEYTHFIDTQNLKESLKYYTYHINEFKGQTIESMYYADTKLTNW